MASPNAAQGNLAVLDPHAWLVEKHVRTEPRQSCIVQIILGFMVLILGLVIAFDPNVLPSASRISTWGAAWMTTFMDHKDLWTHAMQLTSQRIARERAKHSLSWLPKSSETFVKRKYCKLSKLCGMGEGTPPHTCSLQSTSLCKSRN